MYEKLKLIVENSEGILSCVFNEDEEMHIKLRKGAECERFIESFIKLTLEDAILTGQNQIFLFSSLPHRDVFRRKMVCLAHSLGEELDALSSGASLNFVITTDPASAGFTGHAYAVNCFDDAPLKVYHLMLGWTIRVGCRAVFIKYS